MFSRLAALQPLLPKPVGLPGAVVTKMQDLPLGPLETQGVLWPISPVYPAPTVVPFSAPAMQALCSAKGSIFPIALPAQNLRERVH